MHVVLSWNSEPFQVSMLLDVSPPERLNHRSNVSSAELGSFLAKAAQQANTMLGNGNEPNEDLLECFLVPGKRTRVWGLVHAANKDIAVCLFLLYHITSTIAIIRTVKPWSEAQILLGIVSLYPFSVTLAGSWDCCCLLGAGDGNRAGAKPP